MSIELDAAKDSFAKGEYIETVTKAGPVLSRGLKQDRQQRRQDEELKEAILITIESIISSGTITIDDAAEMLVQYTIMFSGCFGSVGEMLKYTTEVLSYMKRWVGDYYDSSLREFTDKIDKQGFLTFCSEKPEYFYNLSIKMFSALTKNSDELLAEEGMNKESVPLLTDIESYLITADYIIPYINRYGVSLSERLVHTMDVDTSSASISVLSALGKDYIDGMNMGIEMMVFGISSDDSAIDDRYYYLMAKYVDYGTQYLNKVIIANNRPIQMVTTVELRRTIINKIKRFGALLKARDPEFILPDLPPVQV